VHRKDQQFSLLHQPSSRAPLRPDTESPLLSPSCCARACATIDTSRKKNSRAKVYIRARSEEMREERDISPREEEEGERARFSLTKSANALRRKDKAPAKDIRRNVRNVGMLEI